MIYTTLNRLLEKNPHESDWLEFIKTRGGESASRCEEFKLADVLKTNSVSDVTWALYNCHPEGKRLVSEFALWNLEKIEGLLTGPMYSNVASNVLIFMREGLEFGVELTALREALVATHGVWSVNRAINEAVPLVEDAILAEESAVYSHYAALRLLGGKGTREDVFNLMVSVAYAVEKSGLQSEEVFSAEQEDKLRSYLV